MSRELPKHPAEYYTRRQAEFESNARTYARKLPIVIDKAKGVYLTDVDGKVYMDCLGGAGTLTLGHNHPVIVEAIRKHLDNERPLHTLDWTTPVKDQFVEDLFNSLPRELAANARIQFCGPSGSDACEAALKLVKTATGRRSILGFSGGYHGQSQGMLALMGNLGPKSAVNSLMPDCHFLPYPYKYRCSLGVPEFDSSHYSRFVENLLDDAESGIPHPAGMILEVVQGEGGCIPCPDDWLREIRRMTKQKKVPLIVDEIQTGWGRTGKLYAIEHSGIVPDVLVLSKAIGGSLPLAVVVYHKDLDVWQPGAHTGTFRGNQLAMATGSASLRFILENDLPAQADRLGRRLMDHLRGMQRDFTFLGDVRGRGLMIGAEVVDVEKRDALGRLPPDGDRAKRIQQECFKRGLIIELGGRNGAVVRFLPPLIITAEEIDKAAGIVGEACAAATAAAPVAL